MLIPSLDDDMSINQGPQSTMSLLLNGRRICTVYHFLWIMALVPICQSWSVSGTISRRELLAKSVASSCLLGTKQVAEAATMPSKSSVQAHLLNSMIPSMPCGAPATNATIDLDISAKIEEAARSLESQSNMQDNAISPQLSGSWRLIYSNAAEISNLAVNLPLGFCLGKTYQPLDTAAGFFENRAPLEHPWHLGKLQVNVVGDVRVAKRGTRNAVDVVNDSNNRVDIDFKAITFELQELLGFQTSIQKSLTPKSIDQSKAQPANDVTYLDDYTRIVRGGDGSLFVFRRETSSEKPAMLSRLEREELFGQRGEDVEVGLGVGGKSQSPELQFLLKDQ